MHRLFAFLVPLSAQSSAKSQRFTWPNGKNVNLISHGIFWEECGTWQKNEMVFEARVVCICHKFWKMMTFIALLSKLQNFHASCKFWEQMMVHSEGSFCWLHDGFVSLHHLASSLLSSECPLALLGTLWYPPDQNGPYRADLGEWFPKSFELEKSASIKSRTSFL